MRRMVGNEFNVSFSRGGGSVVTAQIDVWKAGAEKWQLIARLPFNHPQQREERLVGQLATGE